MLAAGISFSSCSPTRYTVSTQPSVPYYERPISPGAGYVWVDGNWYWHGGSYVYRNGYWAHPRARRTWNNGTWVHIGNGYYWKRGYWK